MTTPTNENLLAEQVEDGLQSAGLRKVNLIWEYTQSFIAISVVLFTMIAGVYAMVYGKDIPSIISVAFGMVTGFYFSRTNHPSIGAAPARKSPEEKLWIPQ